MVDVAYTLMWRRFTALVESLSTDSVFRILYEKDTPKKDERKMISDPNEIQDAIRRMMGK